MRLNFSSWCPIRPFVRKVLGLAVTVLLKALIPLFFWVRSSVDAICTLEPWGRKAKMRTMQAKLIAGNTRKIKKWMSETVKAMYMKTTGQAVRMTLKATQKVAWTSFNVLLNTWRASYIFRSFSFQLLLSLQKQILSYGCRLIVNFAATRNFSNILKSREGGGEGENVCTPEAVCNRDICHHHTHPPHFIDEAAEPERESLKLCGKIGIKEAGEMREEQEWAGNYKPWNEEREHDIIYGHNYVRMGWPWR